MISFEEALAIINSSDVNTSIKEIRIIDSLGHVLASDIYSDIDMPPFDKAAVDGFACRRSDLPGPLKISETIAAGVVPAHKIGAMECSKIMTGAIVPQGADCIVMIEHTTIDSNGMVRFQKPSTANNIAYKAEDVSKGQLVLKKGTMIRPQHIAMMAAVGCVMPQVYSKPVIGILTTGDELVEPNEYPQFGKIRNSNAYQLVAQAKQIGINAHYFGIISDEIDETRKKITESIDLCDVLLITGGVSMGDFDFVPQVIEKAGFNIKFKSIAVQPGKPTLFAEMKGKYLFGLPGNPVSSFVQFELLVKSLLYRLMGAEYNPRIVKLPMAGSYSRKRTDRKSFIPVKYALGKIEPIDYHGSAHIHAYEQAWGIMTMNVGENSINPGELRDVRQL